MEPFLAIFPFLALAPSNFGLTLMPLGLVINVIVALFPFIEFFLAPWFFFHEQTEFHYL